MDLQLQGKVALVTGGARGIGKAVALAFAREGANVGILDLLEEETPQTVAELRALGVQASGCITDVTDVEMLNKNVAKLAGELGGTVHCLVNSAAILINVAKIEDMDPAMWQRDLDVNLTGVFNAVRAVLPYMQKQEWGRIVTISSVAGMLGSFGQAGYSSTKGAVVSLMKTVAIEMARYHITANAIFPGIVGTEMSQFIRPDMKERMLRRSVWRKEMEPGAIADAIVFLCSEPARYVTGIALDLSGGITLFTF